MNILYKIINIFREIKWGFQRMFTGYDERVLWGVDAYTTDIILPALKKIRNDVRSMPFNPRYKRYLTEREWREKLDLMIEGFQLMYDINHMKGKWNRFSHHDENKIINRALILFAEYYRALWI